MPPSAVLRAHRGDCGRAPISPPRRAPADVSREPKARASTGPSTRLSRSFTSGHRGSEQIKIRQVPGAKKKPRSGRGFFRPRELSALRRGLLLGVLLHRVMRRLLVLAGLVMGATSWLPDDAAAWGAAAAVVTAMTGLAASRAPRMAGRSFLSIDISKIARIESSVESPGLSGPAARIIPATRPAAAVDDRKVMFRGRNSVPRGRRRGVNVPEKRQGSGPARRAPGAGGSRRGPAGR